MTSILAIALAGTLVMLAPFAAQRLFERRAPSKTVATFHLLSLVGAATLPVVILACIALIRADYLHGWCPPEVVHTAKWAATVLGVAYLARLGLAAALVARATRRISQDALLASEGQIETEGCQVLVLPVDRPIAYTTGGREEQVVVSRGLLQLLDGPERAAAIAHEIAHVRLRHHRLLLFGQALNRSYGFIPPVRKAFDSLRRELEQIADDEAASAVGDRTVVARALAKVAISSPAPTPALALGNPKDLAYRIDRLIGAGQRDDRRGVAAAAVAAVASAIVVAQCAAFHPSVLVGGLAVCGGSLAWISRRALAPRPVAVSLNRGMSR